MASHPLPDLAFFRSASLALCNDAWKGKRATLHFFDAVLQHGAVDFLQNDMHSIEQLSMPQIAYRAASPVGFHHFVV